MVEAKLKVFAMLAVEVKVEVLVTAPPKKLVPLMYALPWSANVWDGVVVPMPTKPPVEAISTLPKVPLVLLVPPLAAPPAPGLKIRFPPLPAMRVVPTPVESPPAPALIRIVPPFPPEADVTATVATPPTPPVSVIADPVPPTPAVAIEVLPPAAPTTDRVELASSAEGVETLPGVVPTTLRVAEGVVDPIPKRLNVLSQMSAADPELAA